jgi:hypothetical protein
VRSCLDGLLVGCKRGVQKQQSPQPSTINLQPHPINHKPTKPTKALGVYERMLQKGVAPMPATYNAAVCALARRGQLPAALALLATVAAKGVERGVTTYAALLSACEAAGRWVSTFAFWMIGCTCSLQEFLIDAVAIYTPQDSRSSCARKIPGLQTQSPISSNLPHQVGRRTRPPTANAGGGAQAHHRLLQLSAGRLRAG